MPTKEMLGKLRGVGRPRCDFFSALGEKTHCDQPEAPQSVMLECQSEEAARLLLDRLQKTGCIVQGLQRRYVLLDEIGSGNFGVVFKAEDLYTGQYVAIKIFIEEYEQRLMHPFLEASILTASSHANVQGFYGLYEVTEMELLDALGVGAPSTYAIVSEFLEGGDLLTYMQRSTRVTEFRARDLAKQLLSAVSHMHDGAFVHRDLKPENIILTGSGDTIKLIDFGLSAPEEDLEVMRMKAGSPGYVAPEIVTGLMTCKADCFSVGVILFILLTGKALFVGKNAWPQPSTHTQHHEKCRGPARKQGGS
jgi:serine/threonine protein kinase